eukprot:scaffold1595_cov171-Ochromonas_danica.AAC.1
MKYNDDNHFLPPRSSSALLIYSKRTFTFHHHTFQYIIFVSYTVPSPTPYVCAGSGEDAFFAPPYPAGQK